jgi:hypothetical protein
MAESGQGGEGEASPARGERGVVVVLFRFFIYHHLHWDMNPRRLPLPTADVSLSDF